MMMAAPGPRGIISGPDRDSTMPDLCVNIDHVATVRQARRTWEPDPAWAAVEAQLGGAAGITFHLREDRRHIQDADLARLQEVVSVRLNMEMAATDEMVAIARDLKPQMAMLVPEGRQEVTTEGGLDVAGQSEHLKGIVAALEAGGIPASAFIDAEPHQVDAAASCGFSVCELHTGPYAEAFHSHGRDGRHEQVRAELEKLTRCCEQITEAGMTCNAGHALHYANVAAVAAMPGVAELHIGHSIVSRSIYVGIREATREMLRCMAGDPPGEREQNDP
ncbi:MAG: pyridoxine 5'-phosphate synthase [Phycisphaerales bacterium]|nr:pyridoxine 5'-phosphate synthase [Phycisphaerales bacterium]